MKKQIQNFKKHMGIVGENFSNMINKKVVSPMATYINNNKGGYFSFENIINEKNEDKINSLFLKTLYSIEKYTHNKWQINILKLQLTFPISNFIRRHVNNYISSKLHCHSTWLNELLMNSFLSEMLYAAMLISFNDQWNTTRLLICIAFGIFKLVFMENKFKRLNEVGLLFCFVNSFSITFCPYLASIGYLSWSLILLATATLISSKTRITE